MEKFNKENSLTLMHYKEPLLPIPKREGFGYYGALIGTMNGDKVQCHICGKLFTRLNLHVLYSHKITAVKYKEKFKLARTTALMSESERERAKLSTMKWLKSMSARQRAEFLKRKKERLAEMWNSRTTSPRFKIRLETKNKRGTCPDQLIAKIHEVKEKLGHTPSLNEFIAETGGQRYKHLIFSTFGSWLKALKRANITPKEQVRHKTTPIRYSDDELLDMLSLHAQEKGTVPTATDCKRGYIPPYEVFQRHFGTFEKARELAGVYEILNK